MYCQVRVQIIPKQQYFTYKELETVHYRCTCERTRKVRRFSKMNVHLSTGVNSKDPQWTEKSILKHVLKQLPKTECVPVQ